MMLPIASVRAAERQDTTLDVLLRTRAVEVKAIRDDLRNLQARLRKLDACIHTSEFHNIGAAHGELEMACDSLHREETRCLEEVGDA